MTLNWIHRLTQESIVNYRCCDSITNCLLTANATAFFFFLNRLCFPHWRVPSFTFNDRSSTYRMDCLLSTWRRKEITWNASNICCSTWRPLMMWRWTTWRRSTWQRTAGTIESPSCCWTRGQILTQEHWYGGKWMWKLLIDGLVNQKCNVTVFVDAERFHSTTHSL